MRSWKKSGGFLCRRYEGEAASVLTYPINVFDKGSGMLLSKPSRFLDRLPRMFEALALGRSGRAARLVPSATIGSV